MGIDSTTTTRWQCDNCGLVHEESEPALSNDGCGRPAGSWVRVHFEEIGTAVYSPPGNSGTTQPIYRHRSELEVPGDRLYCRDCVERAVEKLDELPQDRSSFAAKSEATAGGHILVGATIGDGIRPHLLCRIEIPPELEVGWAVTCAKCRSCAGWAKQDAECSELPLTHARVGDRITSACGKIGGLDSPEFWAADGEAPTCPNCDKYPPF